MAFNEAMVCTWHELGLGRILADMAATTWVAIGGTSHMELYSMPNEHVRKNLQIPYVKLTSEDVALLEADPAKRQRDVELVKYTWLPPLRVVAKLVETQVGTRGRPRHTVEVG
jgi:hypothetical protein